MLHTVPQGVQMTFIKYDFPQNSMCFYLQILVIEIHGQYNAD